MINIILCDASSNGIKLSRELLYKCPFINIVRAVRNSDALFEELNNDIDADIIVLDINIPFINPLLLIKKLNKEYSHYKVLVNSVVDNLDTIQLAIGFGAAGFLCKKDPIAAYLEEAITNIHTKGSYTGGHIDKSFVDMARQIKPKLPKTGILGISRQEEKVLKLLKTGKSYKQMAEEFSLSVRTIEDHVANIYKKLGVVTRAGAIEVGSLRSYEI